MFRIHDLIRPSSRGLSAGSRLFLAGTRLVSWIPRTSRTTSLVLSFIMLNLSVPALALNSDRNEKLNIAADSGTYNFKSGIDIYEGHVQIDQGTTHITADKLITKKNTQHKIQEATAYGNIELAHFWTQPKPGEPEIHARAKIIKFYPFESNVTLEHDVHIAQGENNFHGELIHYNSNEQTIIVPSSANGRAVLVYNPEK